MDTVRFEWKPFAGSYGEWSLVQGPRTLAEGISDSREEALDKAIQVLEAILREGERFLQAARKGGECEHG